MKLNLLVKTFFAFTLSLFVASNSMAQRKCGTMDAIKKMLETDPVFKADYEKKQKNLDAYIAEHPIPETFANGDTIVVPVVVHIVLPNPNRVTDENVDFFIQRLNEDYSGFNADSGNISTAFQAVRGHSLIRFAMARRDPNGNPTNGIERKVGTALIAGSNPEPIKNAITGLGPWDITKYYNLWVGDVTASSGLLGVSPQIGPGTQSGNDVDGICCNYKMFANNPCYSDASYALARTAVHEIGHNLGLNHTFQGGCTSTDFSDNITSTSFALPASMLTAGNDDTPPTKNPTYNCPAIGTTNGCTPAVPKMFQNYMDYPLDACMTMFTASQVKRMHYVIETFRPGWLTTQGHIPPGVPNDDAAIKDVVSPGGTEVLTCTVKSYNKLTCTSAASFSPKIRVVNYGVNVLNSVDVGLIINGNVVATQTFTNLGLTNGHSTVVTLPNQNLIAGTLNTLKFFTSNPNGVADQSTKLDTATQVVTYYNTTPAPATLPIFEGFEGNDYNPTANGWFVVNSNDGTISWDKTTTAAKTGNGCATIQMFGGNVNGDIDYLQSPFLNLNTNSTDTPYISFDYAYRTKNTATASRRDTLSVEVATACAGTTWTSLWKKGGTQLVTNATNIATSWTATAADWTTTPVKINLWAYKNTPCYIAFKNRNGNGQNIYLDNINIYTVPPLPLKLVSFAAQQNTNNIVCKWETANEENVLNFNVERSIDGKNFEAIATVKALGNTSAAAFYQFADENAYKQKSNTIYYRLKMNDVNGKFTYSKIVAIKVGEKQSVQLYPNPASNSVNIQLTNTNAFATANTIQIVDYVGRVVLDNKVTAVTGTQNFELNISQLAKGSYTVIIKNETEVKTIKFIKD